MPFSSARRLLAASALAATIALTAHAAVAQMRGNFDEADANHDGRVTFAEYQAYVGARLAASDNPIAQKFKQLSADQQAARLHERFSKADVDHKGYLTRENWTAN